MNCNGISCNPEEQGRDDKTVTFACAACSEMWQESVDDFDQVHIDEEKDYNEHPDFERCPACGGRAGEHEPACSEDNAIYY